MTTFTRIGLVLTAVCAGALLCLPAAGQIQAAKLLGNGATVHLSGRMVTHAGSGFCYIQDDNRGTSPAPSHIGGIRVVKASYTFTLGARISVSGAIRTNQDGERYIDCTSVSAADPTSASVVPWMMNNRAIGGSDWRYLSGTGAGQRGVDDPAGPNNIGLLVRTSGFVTYVDPAEVFMYVDDGSALNDGNAFGLSGGPAPGIRVMLPGGDPPPQYAYVTVTGISSIETVAGRPRRALLASDISQLEQFPLMSWVPMACVPDGSFPMGNSGAGDDADDGYPREYPQHSVYVPTFWISKTEVTRSQYRRFVNAGGYTSSTYWSAEGWLWRTTMNRTQPDYWADQTYFGEPFGSFAQGDSRPAVGVSYHEAEAFCNWAGGRLPTEAEWEKAARWDGAPRVYPWGDAAGKSKSNDWYDTSYPGFQTAPVGTGGVSSWGCSDMAGNVWEWTEDWFKSYPGSAAPFDHTGIARSLRGGGYYGTYGDRCACRWFASPEYSDSDVGFRIAH